MGRVVVLNGSSSAGKSTLAAVLQATWALAGHCWVIFAWDDFVPRLPNRWRGVPGAVGDRSADGCRYRINRKHPNVEALIEVGPTGRQMLHAYHRAIAAVARSGVNVIVEEVLISEWEQEDWADALEGIDVRWVAVRCDVDIVERREVERRDRYRGLARGTARVTHRYPNYDIEVDTTSLAAEAVADQITSQLT